MAEERIRPLAETGSLVVYNPSDSHLSTLKKFVADKIAEKNKADILESQRRGAEAALDGEFTPLEEDQAVNRAYNAAAYEVILNTSKTEFDNELAALYSDPKFNASPAELMMEGQKLAREHAVNLPRAVVPDFMVRSGDKIAQFTRQAKSNQMNVTLKANEAAFARYETSVLRDTSNAAEEGQLHVANNFRADYEATLRTQGPIENGGTGLLSEEEIDTKIVTMDKMIQGQLILGEFRRTSKVDKVDFIREVQESDRLEEYFDAEGKDKIVNDMIAEMRQENALDAAERTLENENNAKLADSLYKDWIDNPTIENMEKARPYVEPHQYQKMVDAVHGERYGDDPEVVQSAELRFWRGELTSDTVLDLMGQGLSRATVKEYMNRLQDQAQNAGFTSTEDWKEYKRRLESDFPVATNAFGIRIAIGENAEVQDRIATRMYDTLRSDWVAWQNGDLPEKPDILRQYQLIQKAEEDRQTRENNRKASTVPDKYRNDPKKLVEDFDAGILPKNLRDEYDAVLRREGVIK